MEPPIRPEQGKQRGYVYANGTGSMKDRTLATKIGNLRPRMVQFADGYDC